MSCSDSSETSLHSVGGGATTTITVVAAVPPVPPPKRPKSTSMDLLQIASPSLSADSLSDTTNSSFATPPFSLSPVGESQGTMRWSRFQTFESVSLPLPKIKLVTLPPPRELIIRRQKPPRSDFGFSLRNAIRLDRSAAGTPTLNPTIFAEPGTSAGGEATGLLPGDRLISVNDQSVENVSREVIIEMIRKCDSSVKVKVQPVAELVELSRRCMVGGGDDEKDKAEKATATVNGGDDVADNVSNCNTLRRSASKRFKNKAILSGGDLQDDKIVWLLHRGGFCKVVKSEVTVDQTKVQVTLLDNAASLIVDEDDLEHANPAQLDLVEDICHLLQLNESSVLHSLRQRYASNLIHTMAGKTLIAINPMAPLSLYSEKVLHPSYFMLLFYTSSFFRSQIVSMFRGCKTDDMPPHIYSLTQSAYRTMLETRRDQSIIFMGRSGAGKTTSFKHALYYLTLAAGSVNNLLTVEKLNAINVVLESFGNARTCLNSNATRYTQIFGLDFDQSGQIAAANVQVLLLERSRAGRRQQADHTFHILARLVAGADGSLQKELGLDSHLLDENNVFVNVATKLEEKIKLSAEFSKVTKAFEVLKLDPGAVRTVWVVLAAIVHLGYAGATTVHLNGGGAATESNSRSQFTNMSAARLAANLLNVSSEELSNAVFAVHGGEDSDAGGDHAIDCLEGFVIGLYSHIVGIVVALLNKTVSTNAHSISSMLLVDAPGFQNPSSCGVQTGATLYDLGHNYLQERLQMFFYQHALVEPRTRYTQEMVQIDPEGFQDIHPGSLLSVIDNVPRGGGGSGSSSQRSRGGQAGGPATGSAWDLRDHQERKGLFWLLDEETMYTKSSDNQFLEQLFAQYNDGETNVLKRAAGNGQFVLQHLQGTNPVLYSVKNWLKCNRESSSVSAAIGILASSPLMRNNRSLLGIGATAGSGVSLTINGDDTLRRVSSIRRSITLPANKRKSIMLQTKHTIDGVIDTLRRTRPHFVHCLLAHHNSGTTSISAAAAATTTLDDIVNVPLLRSQIRGSLMLDAARLHRMGFPEALPHSEFVQRFGLLGDETITDNKIEHILSVNDIDASTYRIGPSQVMFRCGILNQLEIKRDELLSDRIIVFQAFCRGYIARRQLDRKRVQVNTSFFWT